MSPAPEFPTVRAADRCPCGSGESFGGCCAPALAGTTPPTAVALMRSRYTAFVVGDEGYLAATWHPGTRPEDLALDPSLRWRGLEIVGARDGQEGDRRGTVEFRAHWREARTDGILHERSRFVHQSGRWWYLDGEIDPAP